MAGRPIGGGGALERGRTAYAERRWHDAHEALCRADGEEPLGVDDLETLAWSAALTGLDEAMLAALERLYHAHLEAGRSAAAARAALWLGIRLASMEELGRAGGWLGRAQRAVECEGEDCVERGFLLLPVAQRHLGSGEDAAAEATAREAAAIADRFGDHDLGALARQFQGRALSRLGRTAEGLALLDEAMVAAASGDLAPLVCGLVYCSVIATCHQVYALDRACEWTSALAEWCEAQPQLVAFTGPCLVHRSEVLQLGGAWAEAAAQARRASERLARHPHPMTVGDARYQEGEIHRLRGEVEDAEAAYREASRCGREPQPGLALLRLAQGRTEPAEAAIHRALAATAVPLQRARFLPARVEIALAIGDLAAARDAARELADIAKGCGSQALDAMADHAHGAVRLAEGAPDSALAPLRRAFCVWQRIGAPFLAARIRVLIGAACRALGDDEGEALELEAAREVFEELGAAAALTRLDRGARPAKPSPPSHGLTPRELEVLRLVAAGMTNKRIAADLYVSERTIDRHVSNILAKLGVPTRSAATAFAYARGLVDAAGG